MATFSVYAHLTPTSHPQLICETLKLTLATGPEEESKSAQMGDSIDNIVTRVKDFMTESRNDGNKVYEVLSVASSFGGSALPLGMAASSMF